METGISEPAVPPSHGLLRVPRHVAIIMDGNGRWARARGLPRVAGHRAGTENLRVVLRAAKAMDTLGNAEARVWVSAVKAMVPERVCRIIDDAIQIHGATGVSQWTPLAGMYAGQRTLRLADGPDEVHWHVVGRAELARYADDSAPAVGKQAGLGFAFSGP